MSLVTYILTKPIYEMSLNNGINISITNMGYVV